MAAPSPTARGTPAGIRLDDGFSTLITLATNPTVSFWEKTVKPPGVDGGDAIQTTTMHNDVWRSMAPKSLKTLTESSSKVAYDPNVYNQLVSLINVETTITVTFPDGSTLAYFGFLQKFETDEISEGEQPTATVTFGATNLQPNTTIEFGPVLTSVAGT